MAVSQAPIPAKLNGSRFLLPGLALSAIVIAVRAFNISSIPALENFLLVFSSLLIEAIPFVLLGAVVAALIEVFVPATLFEKLASVPKPLQLPLCGIAGMAFPVCECGSVPVARRLAQKGLSPAAAVTFMLSAPVLNPIVLASTAVAYRGRDIMWPMVFGRAGLGLLTAVIVGWVVGGRSTEQLLRAVPIDDESHDHSEGRWRSFFGHLSGDFIFMGRFLVIGAVAAATLQTFVPQSIIGGIAGTPILDIAALMALAFLLSLCSESDAFVAASFVQFGYGAQLGFLVFGPMLDTKLAFLYSGTFRRGFLRTVVLVASAVILAGTLWLQVIVG